MRCKWIQRDIGNDSEVRYCLFDCDYCSLGEAVGVEGFFRKQGITGSEMTAFRMRYEGRLYAAESMATFSLSTSAAIALVGALVDHGGHSVIPEN